MVIGTKGVRSKIEKAVKEIVKNDMEKAARQRAIKNHKVDIDADAAVKAVKVPEIIINVYEVKTPDLNAQLVAESIAGQLERRIGFRRAMKMAIARAMRLGAKGIKISCGGRLGGAEIARTEHYHEERFAADTARDIELRLRGSEYHLQ